MHIQGGSECQLAEDELKSEILYQDLDNGRKAGDELRNGWLCEFKASTPGARWACRRARARSPQRIYWAVSSSKLFDTFSFRTTHPLPPCLLFRIHACGILMFYSGMTTTTQKRGT